MKPSFRDALLHFVRQVEDNKMGRKYFRNQLEHAKEILSTDETIVVYINGDQGAQIYQDTKNRIVVVHNSGNGKFSISKPEDYELKDIYSHKEIRLDGHAFGDNVIAAYKRLNVVSTFCDYQINLLNPFGSPIATVGMGDGVDHLFDNDDRAISPGTLQFQLAMQDDLESSYEELMMAYFPDEEALTKAWEEDHADEDIPF
jgi:hypothetical protein